MIMKQSGPQKDAFALLDEFDRLEIIQPSPQWEQTLYAKMGKVHGPYSGKNNGLNFAVLVGCFLLINAVSLVKFSGTGNSREEKRSEVLQSISAELLINPGSLK